MPAAPPDDLGRVVVVSAGFALWLRGRCVAAARFSDIRRLRIVALPGVGPAAHALHVELGDGSLMELRDEAPGFGLFVERAATLLTGMLPVSTWHATLRDAGTPADGVVLYEKPKGW